MSFIIEPVIIAALSSTLASLVAAFYSAVKKRSQRENLKKTNEKLRRRISEISVDLGLIKFTQSIEPAVQGIPREEILNQLENRILSKLQNSPISNDEGINTEIRNDLVDFKSRI